MSSAARVSSRSVTRRITRPIAGMELNSVFARATLEIPLLDSVVPTQGSVPMSFTRASVRRELDYSGLFVELLSGEVGFRGARRERNGIAGSSEDLTNATWLAVSGFTKVNATQLDTAAGANILRNNTAFLTANRVFRVSFDAYIVSGAASGALTVDVGNAYAAAVTIDTTVKRYSVLFSVAALANQWVDFEWTGGGVRLSLTRFHLEDVTGQSNQNPSEYVSVGAAKLNELTYTEEFNNATWPKLRASIATSTVAAPFGSGLAEKLVEDGTAANSHLLSRASGTVGVAATFSVYAKAAERSQIAIQLGATASYFDLSLGTVLSGGGVIEAVGGGWYRCSHYDANPSNTNTIIFLASGGLITYNGDGASGLYIYGSQINRAATAGTYFPVGNVYPFHGACVDGVKWFTRENPNIVVGNVVQEITGVAVPEIPYPQVLKGYTPFPAATNLLTYANDLSNAAWTAVNATKPQATQWPRLRPEALPFRIVDDSTAAAPHGVSRTGGTTITANTNYCLWVAVHSSGFYVSFNARTGAVAAATSGSGTLAASGYINIAKGWGIVYVSGKIDAASTSAVAKLFTLDDDGNLVRDGDGASAMIVDHFQLELGTVPTNIIPTTSAAVTVAGDVLTASYVRNGSGAMSVEGIRDDIGWTSMAVSLSNGLDNRIQLGFSSGSPLSPLVFINDMGVAQANFASTHVLAVGRMNRLAMSFNTDDVRVVANGGGATSDISCSIPQTVDVRFGINATTGQIMMAPISFVRVWDTPLSDAELKAITANGYRDETVNLLTGWNDSSFISRDGRRLYFTYTPLFPYPFLQTQDYSYAPNGPTRRGSPGYTSIENSFDLYCAHLRHDGTVERIECLNLNTATESHFAVMEYIGQPWRLYMGYMSDAQTETRMRSASIDANGKWTFNATSEFDAIHAGGADLGFNDDNPHVVLGTVCVFASGRTSGAVGGTDIWLATRAAIGDPWGSPVNPGVINTLGNEDQFYMHANMVDCYFSRDGEIWHVTWNGGGFNADEAKVTFTVSPALLIGECSIPDDFSFLYFTQIDQATGVSRIMRAPWTGSKTAWGAPVAVD